jgi:hypothetical protein
LKDGDRILKITNPKWTAMSMNSWLAALGGLNEGALQITALYYLS